METELLNILTVTIIFALDTQKWQSQLLSDGNSTETAISFELAEHIKIVLLPNRMLL